MEQLWSVCSSFGCRPSAFLRIEDPYAAVTLDVWVHNVGIQAEKRAAWEVDLALKRRGRRG